MLSLENSHNNRYMKLACMILYMGWVRGFEPPTFGATNRRSNQLIPTIYTLVLYQIMLFLAKQKHPFRLRGAIEFRKRFLGREMRDIRVRHQLQ